MRELKAELVRAGIKQSEIAKGSGRSRGMVCKVLNEVTKSKPVTDYALKLLAERKKA